MEKGAGWADVPVPTRITSFLRSFVYCHIIISSKFKASGRRDEPPSVRASEPQSDMAAPSTLDSTLLTTSGADDVRAALDLAGSRGHRDSRPGRGGRGTRVTTCAPMAL